MELKKEGMLRLKGTNTIGSKQQLFEVFGSFNGKFGAQMKRITENDGVFEVFYLVPDETNKRALKKHINAKHSVTEKPVIAFKITEATDLKAVFEKIENKAKKIGGTLAKSGGNDNKEGTIVFTFEEENKCRRFEMWAAEEFDS